MDVVFRQQREEMVRDQLAKRGIRDERVLQVMGIIPREFFLPDQPNDALKSKAYADQAIAIGEKQTMSQPLIVAMMSAALSLKGNERVLEIGAGSGYGAAVLSHLASEVYSIEYQPKLYEHAVTRLLDFGAFNVHLRCGDGNNGWAEMAPFDGISVTAGAQEIPPPLLEQLTLGGRMVIPVGPSSEQQNLYRITKTSQNNFSKENLGPVAFVPFIGTERWSQRS